MRHSSDRPGVGIILCFFWFLLPAAAAAQSGDQALRLAEEVRAANRTIENLHGRTLINGATANAAERRGIEELIKERAALFTHLIEAEPEKALELSLPEETVRSLKTRYPELIGDLETRGRWEGFLETITSDDFIRGGSRTVRQLYRNGKAVEVFFRKRILEDTGCGDIISVEGISLNNKVAVESAVITEEVLGGFVCTTTGDQRTLALMVTFPGEPVPDLTLQQAQDIFFGTATGRSMDGFWQDASYGATSASGDVYGWFELDAVYSQADYNAVFDAAVRAADAYVDFRNYTRVFLIYPFSPGTSIMGRGTIGCSIRSSAGDGAFAASIAWIDVNYMQYRDYGVSLVAHEGGHNLGLHHSNSRDYGTEALGPLNDPGTVTEYDDPFSNMGWVGQLGHYTARQKQQLNWLMPEEVQTVSSSGVYTINALGSNAPGVKSLKIPRGENDDAWMWVEYRPLIGLYESQLPPAAATGALIHYEDANNSDTSGDWRYTTDLLDFTPGSQANDFKDAPLALGERWADPYTTMFMDVIDATDTTLTVNIGLDPPCVTLDPVSRTHGSGEETGTVEITASPGCSWTVLNLTPWVEVTSPMAGSGSSTLSYRIQENTGNDIRTGYLVIGKSLFTIVQEYLNYPPQAVSVSPDSGSGAAGTFELLYADPNGSKDLSILRFNMNTDTNLANGCALEINSVNETVRLARDDGTTWSDWVEFDRSYILWNSQCDIQALGYDYSGVLPEEKKLVLEVIFPSSFAGTKSLYMAAEDALGGESGWQNMGSWTVINEAPSAVSLDPSDGSGSFQNFTFQIEDRNGFDDITLATVIFNSSPTLDGSCAFKYDKINDEFWLINDTGTEWLGPVPSAQAGTLGNSRCMVYDFHSGVSSVFPFRLQFETYFFFLGSFAGEQNIYVKAQDTGGLDDGWQNMGTYTAVNYAPEISPVSISSGYSGPTRFIYTYTDANSLDDLDMFHATINDEPVYMGGCAIKYDHVNNRISLADDAGTGWLGPVPVEESYRLYNSRCLIDSVQTRLAGQEFMLYVDVFFMGDQAGEKNVYTYAQDFGGLNSGWIEQATFTIVPDNRPLPLAVNPSFGTGYEKTFRLDFVDEDGYTDIEGVIIKIGDGCILLYHTDTDFISNYSQSGTLGSSGIIENSYCAINTDVSTASGNGTVLTLYFAMIFKPGWEGDKNISLTVWDGEGVNEGIRGNWTVGPYISDDFNGDDKADILWRDGSTGAINLWYMDGTTYLGSDFVNTVTDLTWRIAAEADFNTDGETDFLWRNESTGENAVWYMNGITHMGTASLPTEPDLNWNIAGVADFNGDGKVDILWRNRSTGDNVIWLMDGETYMGNAPLQSVTDMDWKIGGVSDFNADGEIDIVWRNESTGSNAVWYMDGVTRAYTGSLPSSYNLDQSIIRIIDYNGDGRADILWHNAATGANSIWYMDGTTITSEVDLEAPASANWMIFDFRNNAPGTIASDAIIDFGPGIGLWAWYNDNTWTRLHNLSPEIIATGDLDGNGQDDCIVDFGPGIGIYVLYNNTTWAKLHGLSAEIIATGDFDGNGRDDCIIDFGPSTGLWIRYNNTTWTKLHNLSPEIITTGDLDGNGKDDCIIDFGSGIGVYVFYNNTTWEKLHSSSPEIIAVGDLDGSGQDDCIIDFGTGTGIWVRYNDNTWSKLHSQSPEIITTGDLDGNGEDDCVIDFGAGIGIWARYNNIAWTKLHSLSPEIITTGDMDGNGQDEVIIDFGPGIGLYVLYNNTNWTILHSLSPEIIETGNMDNN